MVHGAEGKPGIKIIDIREPKLEKEVEQKSFKKGTGEGVLIAFPHHLCGHNIGFDFSHHWCCKFFSFPLNYSFTLHL